VVEEGLRGSPKSSLSLEKSLFPQFLESLRVLSRIIFYPQTSLTLPTSSLAERGWYWEKVSGPAIKVKVSRAYLSMGGLSTSITGKTVLLIRQQETRPFWGKFTPFFAQFECAPLSSMGSSAQLMNNTACLLAIAPISGYAFQRG